MTSMAYANLFAKSAFFVRILRDFVNLPGGEKKCFFRLGQQMKRESFLLHATIFACSGHIALMPVATTAVDMSSP